MGYRGGNRCQHMASIRAVNTTVVGEHPQISSTNPFSIHNSTVYSMCKVKADATGCGLPFCIVLGYYTRWSVVELLLRTEGLRWPNPTVQVATQTWRVRTFSALYRQIFHPEVFPVTTLLLRGCQGCPPST